VAQGTCGRTWQSRPHLQGWPHLPGRPHVQGQPCLVVQPYLVLTVNFHQARHEFTFNVGIDLLF
jgi:hypothetical protein